MSLAPTSSRATPRPAPSTKPTLEGFAFEAVVDFVELLVHTAAPTNAMLIKRELQASRVKGLDEGPGRAATTFKVYVNDPPSWADVIQRFDRLARTHPLAEPVKVTAVEVSLDAYHVLDERTALIGMAKRFFRGLTVLVSKNRRLYGAKGTPVTGVGLQRDLDAGLGQGLTLGIGEEHGDKYQRIYVKTVDHKMALPTSEHRARVEVRLGGAELPCTSLEAWQRYKLTDLALYFRFRMLKAEIPDRFVAQALKVGAQFGERRPRKGTGNSRMHSSSTVADRDLNDTAYEALRKLQRRMVKLPKR